MSSKQACALLGSLAAVAGIAGCGETVTTSKFSGESHAVAERVSSFQKHATEGSQGKLCQEDLAESLKGHIKATGKTCEEALKEQLKDVEDVTLSITSIAIGPHAKTATAKVQSIWSGKKRASTLTLVKEGEAWKVSGLQ